MFAKLSETSPGLFELPLVQTVGRLNRIIELAGTGKEAKRVRMAVLSPAERFSFGWVEFSEEKVDKAVFVRGVPTDTFQPLRYTVIRSFNSKTFRRVEDLKKVVRRNIAQAAVAARQEGLSFDGGVYPTGEAEIALYTAFMAAGGALPAIYDTDGVMKKLNSTAWGNFATALVARMVAIQDNKVAHNTALLILNDPAAIVGYDFTTGW